MIALLLAAQLAAPDSAAREGRISLEQELLLVNQFASIVDGTPYRLDAGVDGDSALYALIGRRVAVRDARS